MNEDLNVPAAYLATMEAEAPQKEVRRIVVNAIPAISGTVHERMFGAGLLNILPGVMPEVQFYFEQYYNDNELDGFDNVQVINPHEVTETTYLSTAPTGEFDPAVMSAIMVVTSIDQKLFPKTSWWKKLLFPHDHFEMDITRATALLVSHSTLRQQLIEQYDFPAAKIHVVGHGLPPEEARITPADSVTRRITREVYGHENSYFLAKATGHANDNLERLFAAYDKFRQRCPEPVRLLIETEGKQQPRAVRKARDQAKHRSDIIFLSPLSPAERRKVVSSARALIDVSLSSAFPLSVLDAWTAEVPIVSTDNAILQGAGTLVQAEDVNSIAEGLVALVTTPFLASGLVGNGKRRVQDFSWERVAEHVATVLRQYQ